MKYPIINKQPSREVGVPQFSGGLNLRDGLTKVRDNQLTDCVNTWYKDGTVKTRPGFISDETMRSAISVNDGYKIIDKKVHLEITNNNAVLVSLKLVGVDTVAAKITFCWQNDCLQTNAGFIEIENLEYENPQDIAFDYFVSESNGVIYCYISNYDIYKFDYKNSTSNWEKVLASDYYIPLVLAHAKATNNGLSYDGTVFEGNNLLSKSYKMVYSTINLSDIAEGQTWMRYPFVSKLPVGVDTTIIAKLKTIDGKEYEHQAVWTGGKELRCFEMLDKATEDGLYLYVTAYHVHFVTEMGTSKIATLKKEDYLEDNLEITVIYSERPETEKLDKVFKMTRCSWFGGAANDIKGGSRLFLCGNTAEKEGALVIWSALDNPLYFNENNYVYVGNKSQRVTTLAKQGENLIIFKDNEIYYSYYANREIDAETMITNQIEDYEANSISFSVFMLNSSVGCDCADTIQLCRNRLVWLNSNGNVYTLTSANQYNERSVYVVSEMIANRLENYSKQELCNASAQDFGGYYMLIINSDAFLMDYNSYGYTHIYSYTKNDDANVMIPWYYWTLLSSNYFKDDDFIVDSSPYYFAMGENIIAMYECHPISNYYYTHFSVLNFKNQNRQDTIVLYGTDKNAVIINKNIKSKIVTKMYDFSAPHYLKNIECVSVVFANNLKDKIDITFVADTGCENNIIWPTGDDGRIITVKNFYPTLRAVKTFGLKIECEGQLSLTGLTLKYRVLGGAK